MCALRIVQHLTRIYYHDLEHDYCFDDQLKNIEELQSQPSSEKPVEKSKSLLPHRSAVSELMAQLPASDFPELIEQILLENYDHSRGDITDGPGDQSRDIHTVIPNGEKHLTQCRHTENPHKANLNRHDLDELWAATGRLRYEHGLLVTNADMTRPAKASYRNGEYSRHRYPDLKVWNGRDLWDEIRSNQNILNRWFSGLAQLHTVNRFSFRMLPVDMPNREPAEVKNCIYCFIRQLEKQGFTIEQTGLSWKIENDDMIVFMREWFASVASLFMPCILKPPHDLRTAPFSILEFHVINKTNRISHDSIRDWLCSILLKSHETQIEKWIAMLASPLMAPVYIQDTEDVVVSGIKPYTSFILMNGECFDEFSAAISPPDEFIMASEDELYFVHNESGIGFSVRYSQPVDEGEDDTLKIIFMKAEETLMKSVVFEVCYNDDFEFSMALASANFTNLVLEDTEAQKLYFCFKKDDERKELIKSEIIEFIRSLKLQKISSRLLEPDEVKALNQRLPNEVQFETQNEKACNTISNLIFPINFQSRVTISMAEIGLSKSVPDFDNLALELFKYKMHEQHKSGFDEGFKVGANEISLRQLKNILWRPTKITGRESINIGFNNYPDSIKLMIYFKPNSIETLVNALNETHSRTIEHIKNIEDLIAKL